MRGDFPGVGCGLGRLFAGKGGGYADLVLHNDNGRGHD
jgi:hypothetical protein